MPTYGPTRSKSRILCSGFPIKFRISQEADIFCRLSSWLPLNICFVLFVSCSVIFSPISDRSDQALAITGCSARGLFRPLSGDVQPPPLYWLLKASELVKRGYGFRSKGGQPQSKGGKG